MPRGINIQAAIINGQKYINLSDLLAYFSFEAVNCLNAGQTEASESIVRMSENLNKTFRY